MKYIWFYFLFGFVICGCTTRSNSSLNYVNPFIGTANSGHVPFADPDAVTNFTSANTTPAAIVPWGMAAAAPRNTMVLRPWNSSFGKVASGYYFGDPHFYGFSQNTISGTGCHEMGHVLLMPLIGTPSTDIEKRKSSYSQEMAEPGYYAVNLVDFGIKMEATATARSTIYRTSTVNNTDSLYFTFDLFHSLKAADTAFIEVVDKHSVRGWIENGGFCASPNNQKVHFYATFNEPFLETGTWNNRDLLGNKTISGKQIGAFARFNYKQMKNTYTKTFISVIALIAISCQSGQKETPEEVKAVVKYDTLSVKAPFEMPDILSPNFEECPIFSIVDYGAKEGDQEANTVAIAKAISAANEAGCGKVKVPAGEWLTGKIHFKSNVNLHLAEGATLLFSGDPQDYLPAVHTTWEGMECMNYSPLIYAFECENIAITGKGKLQAKLDTWINWYGRTPAHMNGLVKLYEWAAKGALVEERMMVADSINLRPHFIQFNRSKHIKLENIKIKNSPFWVVHPYLSKDVVVRGVNIQALKHNNDGVDVEMSQNVLIENCTFDQGDDAVVIKAGRNQDAWRLNTPSKNILVRNCEVINGHQLLAIGSELSGGIENVLIEKCEVLGGPEKISQPWLFVKHLIYVKTNERRGGYVKNIYAKDIKAERISSGILGIETDVLYQWRDLVPTYERRLTPISDIYLENMTATNVQFVSRILGQEELPVKNISLKNIAADTVRGQRVINENVIGFTE